jgi:hypothetical protein
MKIIECVDSGASRRSVFFQTIYSRSNKYPIVNMSGPWASQLDEPYNGAGRGAIEPGPIQHNIGRLMTESSSAPYEENEAQWENETPFASIPNSVVDDAKPPPPAQSQQPRQPSPAPAPRRCTSCGKPKKPPPGNNGGAVGGAKVTQKKCDVWMIILWVVIGVIIVVIIFALAKCFGSSNNSSAIKS